MLFIIDVSHMLDVQYNLGGRTYVLFGRYRRREDQGRRERTGRTCRHAHESCDGKVSLISVNVRKQSYICRIAFLSSTPVLDFGSDETTIIQSQWHRQENADVPLTEFVANEEL